MYVFASSPGDYCPRYTISLVSTNVMTECSGFVRGLGSPVLEGLKSKFWCVSSTLVSHIVYPWLNMPQFRYGKHATVFVRGLGPPMAGAWRKRRAFVSCVLYVTAR